MPAASSAVQITSSTPRSRNGTACTCAPAGWLSGRPACGVSSCPPAGGYLVAVLGLYWLSCQGFLRALRVRRPRLLRAQRRPDGNVNVNAYLDYGIPVPESSSKVPDLPAVPGSRAGPLYDVAEADAAGLVAAELDEGD